MWFVDALGAVPPSERELVDAACRDDPVAFDRLVVPYRGELHAHCYRMLGSVQDAEDALQNALLGAWQGLSKFDGRSSLRSWLYRIATNACLRLVERRPKRLLVAALQYLPATQRAVLILREVLAFSAAEVATQLDTTVASVNSARQRARRSLDQRAPEEASRRRCARSLRTGVASWWTPSWPRGERADVPAILDMLVEDARLTMPPLPTWFHGLDDIGRFMTERMFATPWRLVPLWASGQLAFACYQGNPDGTYFRLGALQVLTLRGGRIVEMTGFLDPETHARFGLSGELPG